MTNKSIILFFVFSMLLVSCSPSAQAVQTAVAQTQAAYTPTPLPTATTNPCTDKGWKDIETYVKQFDLAKQDIKEGTSINAFLDGLKNINAKINDVEIDACTESIRQTVVNSCANQIYALTLIALPNPDNEQIMNLMTESAKSLLDAKLELQKLGITFDY